MPGVLLWLIAWIMRIYAWTLRTRYLNAEKYSSEQEFPTVIFTMWHNRILFLASLSNMSMRRHCTVLISNSRDGEYITGIARQFGVEPVRGSSSKGALHALHELSDAIEGNRSPIITLDGPRGPKYTPHPGAVMLALRHGVPIVPFSINAESYWQLRSWDNLQIPRPFSKVEFIFGQPLHIEKGTPRETALEMLRTAMDEVTRDK